MALTKERTAELVKKFGKNEHDTGSVEVQIALLTQHNPQSSPPRKCKQEKQVFMDYHLLLLAYQIQHLPTRLFFFQSI